MDPETFAKRSLAGVFGLLVRIGRACHDDPGIKVSTTDGEIPERRPRMRFRRHLAAGVLTVGCLGGMTVGAAEAGAEEPVAAADCTAPAPDGDLLLPGVDIADELPLLGPILQPLTDTVGSVVGSTCEILVPPAQPEAPGSGEQQPPAAAPTTTPSSAPSGNSAATPSGGRLAAQESSGAVATARFGFADPLPFGPALNFGAPGTPPQAVAAGKADVVSTQRPTGTAEALPVTRDELSQPVLLATLALTLVSAQLVRTWVRRMRGEVFSARTGPLNT
ncbi:MULTISPECIES: hypothetical protein [unclassified Amycolatopsis]|uniref:hypothetical protein n=1 Tax=unclassified Amycolatopsis TaxID=2618356 RepID=UPI001F25913B|nr:hypothetical protein [Amycolatopsis sp. ATCC 39116]